MKFCLSSRQTDEYLKQADEIKVASHDYNQIYDLIDKYPEATIILNYIDQPVETMRELAFLAKNRLILSFFDFAIAPKILDMKIPFYYGVAIENLDQLRALKDFGVCYALLDGVLMHQLHETKIIGVPIRAIPNIAFLDGIPRENGINGNWIRPEDIDEYSLYIDTIEFSTQPQKREQTLFKLYAKDKEWNGPLSRIVPDLNNPVYSNRFKQEYILRRMNCEMKCATQAKCTLCYDLTKIALSRFGEPQNQAVEEI